MSQEERCIIGELTCNSTQVRAFVLAHLRLHPEIDGHDFVVQYNRALAEIREDR